MHESTKTKENKPRINSTKTYINLSYDVLSKGGWIKTSSSQTNTGFTTWTCPKENFYLAGKIYQAIASGQDKIILSARLANQGTYYIYTFLPFSQVPFPFSSHLSVDFPGFFSYSPLLTGSAFSFRLLPLAVKNWPHHICIHEDSEFSWSAKNFMQTLCEIIVRMLQTKMKCRLNFFYLHVHVSWFFEP